MASIADMWNRLEKRARVGIAAGAVLILAVAVGLGIWAYGTNYQVLFANLAPRDAAAMTAELEKMKVPYQLADDGHTILVGKADVYRTRLKLMGNEIPLQGAVGFEVFNNADFGMTEFVQKVNYQRALQGELTRTILSIEEIQTARVHLAIPEQGLFKKSTAKPKASVTLSLKPRHVLAPEQISGIQRLVAASVPDIAISDVTVIDRHGVALTRIADQEGQIASTTTQLDSKKMTEDYLLQKVNRVLEQTLGAGEAVATVDVSLNLDQSRVTTEEVLPAKGGDAESSPVGVVVRERQSTKDGVESFADTAGISGKMAQSGGSSTIENDYQVGRRVEQVVTAAGALKRVTVAVVVKRPLEEAQIQRIRDVVGSVVGISSQRGDSVVVYSVNQLADMGTANTADAMTMSEEVPPSSTPSRSETGKAFDNWSFDYLWIGMGILLIVLTGLFLLAFRSRSPSRMNEAERTRMLADIHAWIQSATPSEQTGQTR